MESLASRRGMAGNKIEIGDVAKYSGGGGGSGDGDAGDELSNLTIGPTSSGPYAAGDMDQFEGTIDFDSSYPPSDASEKKPVKKSSMLFGTKFGMRGGPVKAVSNPETLADLTGAERALNKIRNLKVEQPQAPKKILYVKEIHDPAQINNLVMSISQYIASDKVLDKYWDFDGFRTRVAERTFSADQKAKQLLIDLRQYSRAAFLLHGCKADMRVLTDWIPLTVWSGDLTDEKFWEAIEDMESKITSNTLKKVSKVIEQWMRIPGFPKLPKTVSELYNAVGASKSADRRVKFKMLVEGHDLESYRWIEDTLDSFKDILPLRSILSNQGPLNLIRDHLIAMMVAWASIYYDTVLLKDIQRRLQAEHEAECAALQIQSARGKPESGLVRDSEMLEMLSDEA